MNVYPSLASGEADASAVVRRLAEARERSIGLVGDFSGAQLLGPRLPIVNPPLWEIGHLGWFQERWCLRTMADGTLAPSLLPGSDTLYDSAAVPHATRWDLPLPSLDATLRYLSAVLEHVFERMASAPPDSGLLYFADLASRHEEMHAEAFTYTCQTLGYRAPGKTAPLPPARPGGPCTEDVEISGGIFMLGAEPRQGFVFDNEKWAHEVAMQPFRMARAPVTNAEFAAFVDDRGYSRRELWSDDGWAWRVTMRAKHPVYWQRDTGRWLERRYDGWRPPAPHEPAMHVNWHEAQAYCRWAQRRLPTEAEWEYAAAALPTGDGRKRRYPWGNAPPDREHANLYHAGAAPIDVGSLCAGDSAWGCRQMIGNVWEWTASAFGPYPGFVVDPYKEYSEPWFGNHKVLRGGCHATRGVLISNTWRNFYTADRRDVFAGFRTCAP